MFFSDAGPAWSGGEGLEGVGDGRAVEGDEALGFTAGPGEAGQVGLHVAVGLEGEQGGVEDGEGAGVGGALDAVVHPLPFAAGGDDAGVAEVGEVAGDFGLALLEDFDEVADADFPACHEVEETQAGGVGEGCEETSETREIEFAGGFCHESNIRLDRYIY